MTNRIYYLQSLNNGVMLCDRSQRWLWLCDVSAINYTTADFYAASSFENDANFRKIMDIFEQNMDLGANFREKKTKEDTK